MAESLCRDRGSLEERGQPGVQAHRAEQLVDLLERHGVVVNGLSAHRGEEHLHGRVQLDAVAIRQRRHETGGRVSLSRHMRFDGIDPASERRGGRLCLRARVARHGEQ